MFLYAVLEMFLDVHKRNLDVGMYICVRDHICIDFLDVFFPYWRDILRRIFEEMPELIFFLGGDT